MVNLGHYLQDGASNQARAVVQYVNPNIEHSYSDKEYRGVIKIARWENGREQGYILSLTHNYTKQWNIIVYEHRNSDNICAISWEQSDINSINLRTIKEGVFEHKYDSITHSVGYGKVVEMAEWINEDFERFWGECEEEYSK